MPLGLLMLLHIVVTMAIFSSGLFSPDDIYFTVYCSAITALSGLSAYILTE